MFFFGSENCYTAEEIDRAKWCGSTEFMKTIIAFFLTVYASDVSLANSQSKSQNKTVMSEWVQHLPLDLDSSEYQRILRSVRVNEDVGPDHPEDVTTAAAAVDFLIKKGTRNIDFLKFINTHKAPAEQLAFTSAELQKKAVIPIDKAKTYSPAILQQQLDDLRKQIPVQLGQIILGTDPFVYPLSVTDEEYLTWARAIDKLYQTASRWKTLEPYLMYLADAKANDIRGYYFLSKEENLEAKLLDWKNLEVADQIRLGVYLEGLCRQDYTPQTCLSQLRAAQAQHVKDSTSIKKFYDQKVVASQVVYNDFFMIVNPRKDIIWSATMPSQLHLPFRDPQNSAVKSFLKDNIEDEWKLNGWQLILDFVPQAAVNVAFEAGTTPHVDSVGGNTITMDTNQPLFEFGVQWTIRHEFGHVLGFPDCYVEFYDVDRQEMVNYQIDTSNIMCSRAGHLQQTHFDELKKNYYKSQP